MASPVPRRACTARATGRHKTPSGEQACPVHGARARPASTPAATLPPDTVLLPDADDRMKPVTPGVIDDAAIDLYRSGQCLPLAMALADRIGSGRVVVLVSIDPEHPDVLRAGDLHHAWALSPNGTRAYDIDEERSIASLHVATTTQSVRVRPSRMAVLTTDQARMVLNPHSELEHVTARTFADAIAVQRPEVVTDAPVAEGEARPRADGGIEWFLGGRWIG